MRRLATTLGVLGASVALTLGLTPSASAASGTLMIDGHVFRNPTGCNRSDAPGNPATLISNFTDSIAYVYSDPLCRTFIGIVMPLQAMGVKNAWSVRYY
ncbi:hypothetical protein ACFZB6_08215 [Streptomyces syringium]|uniref:hypothetical protein n=1 Tax=Streptomyces syringium TaxID=76729 RepID=UPI0033A49D35